MIARTLLAVFLIATPAAAGTFLADFEQFTAPRSSLNGYQYGPFGWGESVALHRDTGAAQGQSWLQAAEWNDFGPGTIRTEAPARLLGGWFSSTSGYLTIAVDADHGLSDDLHSVPLSGVNSWTHVDLDVPFGKRLTFSSCEIDYARDPANFCFSDNEANTPIFLDNLELFTADIPGDTNSDGQVDLTDLNNVRNNFGDGYAGIPGDTNGDYIVDLQDLNAVRNNFGTSQPIPEPSSLAIALAGIMAITALRRRRTNTPRRLLHSPDHQ